MQFFVWGTGICSKGSVQDITHRHPQIDMVFKDFFPMWFGETTTPESDDRFDLIDSVLQGSPKVAFLAVAGAQNDRSTFIAALASSPTTYLTPKVNV